MDVQKAAQLRLLRRLSELQSLFSLERSHRHGEPCRMVRNWCINGRFLGQPLTGVQRYAREIVTALDALVDEGHPLAEDLNLTLLASRGADSSFKLRSIVIKQIGFLSGYAWEQLTLPLFVEGGLISLGNVGPIATRRQILCIHDTIARDWPRSYSWKFRASQRLIQGWLGRSAARVTTVSAHAAEGLRCHRVCDSGRIAVAANGHEHVRRWTPQITPKTESVDRRTVVLLGTPAPHKNVRMLIGAVPALRERGLHLALVGGMDPKIFRSEVGGSDDLDVIWLGRLTDGELATVLSKALCLAFPSLHEGFGLPVLEAMAVGCPVVASTLAGLPALCDGAALCIPPDRPDLWVEAFSSLERDPALRERKRDLGLQRAQAFSWRQSAEIYLRMMADIDALLPEPGSRAPSATHSIPSAAMGER